jgi:hypothetical protein
MMNLLWPIKLPLIEIENYNCQPCSREIVAWPVIIVTENEDKVS